MATHEFLVIYGSLLVTMLIARVVPLFLLKGRALSNRVMEAIGLIPAAAFSALVANDVLSPDAFAQDPIGALIPLAAAVPVVFVAMRTRSLIWSALVGMCSYAALSYLIGLAL